MRQPLSDTTTLPLYDILDRAISWQRCPDSPSGHVRFNCYINQVDDPHDLVVALDDLLDYDLRLGLLFATLAPHTHGVLSGNSVRNSLEYWRHNKYKLPKDIGPTSDATETMEPRNIFGIALSSDPPDTHVYIMGSMYDVATTNFGLHYPSCILSQTTRRTAVYMSERFPGWRDRLSLAASLDLNTTALINFVLGIGEHANAPVSSLSTLSLPDADVAP